MIAIGVESSLMYPLYTLPKPPAPIARPSSHFVSDTLISANEKCWQRSMGKEETLVLAEPLLEPYIV